MNSRILGFLSAIILFGCLVFSQWAFAQAPAAEPAAQPAAQPAQPAEPAAQPAAPATPPAAQKATLPSPMDKDLAFLLGQWNTKIKIFPNALLGNTEELKGAGKAEYKIFGKVIEGILTSETSKGTYEGREFIWYDPSSKSYILISISPEGYAINKKMTAAGSKYVVEYSGTNKAKGGAEINFTVRAKYKIISDTEVKYSSDVKIGKADFVPFIQLKMQRVSK